jgi:hypothetical protein
MTANIAWDEGGWAFIREITLTTVEVCTGDASRTAVGKYPTIGVEIWDGKGDKQLVEVALVDCEDCCRDTVISGAPTVNPDSPWVGSIYEPCPGGTCEAVSNSGCGLPCAINPFGTQATVAVGPDHCGSFTVTVTDSCRENSFSAVVRINDLGQGGEWVKETSLFCQTANCGTNCLGCTEVPCDFSQPATVPVVLDNQYKFGVDELPAAEPCEEDPKYFCNWNDQGAGQCDGEPPNNPNPPSDLCDDGCECYGAPCIDEFSNDWFWMCHRCEWECTC